MRVLTVVGARPQFIKAAPVSRALREAGINEAIVHTGQHYDDNMSGRFFEELGIEPPAVNLAVGSGSHAEQTARMLVGLEPAFREHRPDWVVVYGDTNSTLAGALAASKLHLPVAHVEAGLRSFNRRMPEEINRVVVDALSDLLLAPTDTAVSHLRREGVADSRICLTGDVMFDAALHFGERARRDSTILDRLDVTGRPFVLATIHRAENTDDSDRLRAIADGFLELSRSLRVVWPLHPRTKAALDRAGVDLAGIQAPEPLGYLDLIRLEMAAAVVATDSGGVQKEAFFHRVPCVTLRDETEWTELVEAGWNRLTPPISARAVSDSVRAAIGSQGSEIAPYGNGTAAQVIATALLEGAGRSFSPRNIK